MKRRVLLIVAAGKSSRFGGIPKAFCTIGDGTNADNTIKQSKGFFDKVYIGVNPAVYDEYSSKISDCEIFSIVPGQGDAHSLLKCLNYIKNQESDLTEIYVCWGDAFFVDSQPFDQFIEGAETGKFEAAVACAEDKKPYAWFEVDGDNRVLRSRFASENGGAVEEGVHDQSLFFFDLDFAIKYLNEYREFLGIPYDNDDLTAGNNEMKLLYSFEYLRDRNYEPAKCISITANKVLSFNTPEELNDIKLQMFMRRCDKGV